MIGIDIIKIERIEHMMKRFEQKALVRFLCEEEIALVRTPSSAAGFWAIKEALAKALGCGIGSELSFHDIKIYKDEKGAPHVALRHDVIEKFQIRELAASITHDGGFAIGVVVVQTRKELPVKGF